MFDRLTVKKALKRSLASGNDPGRTFFNVSEGRDSEVSLLIHDIFGGEILKTSKKRGWYFYNRVNGKRLDLTGSGTNRHSVIKHFEDIPSTPDETNDYVAQEDYSTFYLRFIRAFEEAVGLKKYQSAVS